MDMIDRDKPEVEKRNEEPMSYHSPGMSTDWRYTDGNFVNSSMGLVPNRNPITVCGDVVDPSCSSSSMVDSFGPTMWDHPVNSALGFTEMNVPNGLSSSDPLSMLKSGLFLPNMSGMLPHSLSQFLTDSAFIERAARFSSFNRGHFSDILNPLGVHQPTNPYIRAGMMMPVRQPQKSEANIAETLKDDSLPPERFHDVAKQDASVSRNDSDEAGFSGGGGGEEDGTPSPAKGLSSKKRKRGNKEAEPEQAIEVQQQSGEAGKNDTEIQHKGDQNSTPTGNKSNGKNGKQNSQVSDPTKEGYIHVRARRGQATNSHSLAERVRREKISERMKFLQDLVPGCSKVTGKAVMLDEIINYVQSLQRQVEFLSMKLTTVNPRLDANIERLLAKDMFSARAGPSSGVGFLPEMAVVYPQLHPTQPSMLQPSLHATTNSSDVLRRTITSQMMNAGGGYKEPASQVTNAWEDELHNVVQMGFNASAPLDNQETNCPVPSGQTKAES